jgi:hypothetical protein
LGVYVILILFPAYRTYQEARIAANDAMMALLIGSRLGAHTLELNAGSPHLIPEIFPGVNGAKRLNRTVADAQSLMRSSEKYLAYMAIPFVLSVHATLLVAAVRMIREDGKDQSSDDPTKISLDELHERIEGLWPSSLPAGDLRLFHFSRYLRNRIIHFGGAAGSNLRTDIITLPLCLAHYGWRPNLFAPSRTLGWHYERCSR